MSKNWLIRTKSNHILGPISKEKVLELLQNGSIKADDEVCSGNGFWFFIREDDMVARFLAGREQQNFNPISEAKDVLTHPGKAAPIQEEDITMVGGINITKLNEKTTLNGSYVSSMPTSETKTAPSSETKKKVNIVQPAPVQKIKKPRNPKPTLKKQNYLQYLLAICFLLLLVALWYRKTIFRYLNEEASISLISHAYAQEESPAEKKK